MQPFLDMKTLILVFVVVAVTTVQSTMNLGTMWFHQNNGKVFSHRTGNGYGRGGVLDETGSANNGPNGVGLPVTRTASLRSPEVG